ncbi:MAG: Ig-like domain-containing protein [Alistipes sp.]|jgi:hypothetical protein|nr:Ig-like domain-containing protein [Alistipes sp.]
MDTGVLWNKDHTDRLARFNPAARTFGGNLILVYGKASGSNRSRWEVTSSMFHELGHATHWQAVVDKRGANRWSEFINAEDRLVESWARGVQASYMRAFYPDYLQTGYHTDYTAIVESMMNQGMTLKQIEDAMVGESEWNNWRSNVLATGRIPAVIVDMIFNNPLTPVRVNMVNPITGPTTASTTNITYSVPGTLPGNVTFNGWTVSPNNNYTTTGGMAGRTLNIKFLATGNYTVTANFTLPNGTSYAPSKTVSVTGAPTITNVTWRSDGGPGVPVSPGNYAYFTAVGDLTGATLEWTKGIGCDPYGGFIHNSTTYAALFDGSDQNYIMVNVRAQRNGVWSNTYYAYAPVQFYAPAPNSEEETEETEETETESTAESAALVAAIAQ